MRTIGDLVLSDTLDCLADTQGGSWVLLEADKLNQGSYFIAQCENREDIRIAGYYDGETGDVFDCADATALWRPTPTDQPAVRIVGSINDASGQITVRQEEGNYLRISNWDRLADAISTQVGATLRTLPQCGCGGSLGSPKLFDTFAQMSAYHFCAFYL